LISLATFGDTMSATLTPRVTGEYSLATGKAGARRLEILHQIYGPGTRRLLERGGVALGLHVADIGCGVGTVTAELAHLVGSGGRVVGVDVSPDQLAQARDRLAGPTLASINFVEASATNTGLPDASFDLVYCRFLLLHLAQPHEALLEMHRLLRPHGILVCEDGDLTSAGSEPPSALGLFAELFGRLGPTRKLDYTLGRRLYHMVRDAGFSSPQIAFSQPAFASGDRKRLLELSVAEAGDAFIQAGLITREALDAGLVAMQQLAEDETVLALMPRMAQVWARKSEAALAA
jgi:SAM-dependent methyltransferase